jgi:AraC-like DNA-binding protein
MQPFLHLSYRPGPPLAQFVEQMWYWDGPQPAHARDRILPSGCASLIINLAEDEVRDYVGPLQTRVERHPGAVLVGAYSRYTAIDAQEQRAVIGVVFRPGGMTPFFAQAADEFHNTHAGLRDVWGDHGATIRARVLEASTPKARLEMVARELTQRAVRPLTRRPEVDFLIAQLSAAPTQSITDLSQRAGLSARRISRLFALETGLTPKLFARIKRFEHALHAISSDDVHWTHVAQRCGYFDQSHLIHDFRELSGFTPSQLQARRLGQTRHIPL